MKMRWAFRCYPTADQAEHLNRTFGCVRYVWNWALRMRTDAYRAGERIARIHERIVDSRADPLHQLAHDLIKRFAPDLP